jgi:hypothetical protein
MNRAEFQEIKQKLINNGWIEQYSVMTDSNKGKNYGVLFIKNDKEFWLNIETFKEVAQ